MGACVQDVHYSPDQYGNPKDGYRFYTEKMGVQVVAASQEVFFAKILVDSHMAELLHGWMGSIAKTESFNETFWGKRQIAAIQRFLKFNPSVANHFRDQAKNDNSPDIEGQENEKEERKTIFEMKRKSLSRVLLKSEIIKECTERNIVESFGPKMVGGEQKSLNQTMDDFMEKIGELRKSEILIAILSAKNVAANG